MDRLAADTLRVRGGHTLRGRVRVHAAKNAVLPLLATCLLTGESVRLHAVPALTDVLVMADLLRALGADVRMAPDGSWVLRAEDRPEPWAPNELVGRLRASVLILGPLVARVGRARLSLPGGCAIGTRPIDLHLKGLAAMGVSVRVAVDRVDLSAPHGLRGACIALDYPSVTATENLMLAASLARGRTVIRNAAAEPEVVDLAACLNGMGAQVRGAGTAAIHVEGRPELGGAVHTPIPDRIEAGTLLIAACMTGGEATVEGVVADHLTALITKLRQVGAEVWAEGTGLRVRGPRRARAVDVTTQPYPGFATDLQPMFCALLAVAAGESVVTETVFDDRLGFAALLRDMGAEVHVEGRVAFIRGVTRLRPGRSVVPDLRGGAAMVLAALVAEGETELTGLRHIDRGYVNLAASLQALGADVERGKETRETPYRRPDALWCPWTPAAAEPMAASVAAMTAGSP